MKSRFHSKVSKFIQTTNILIENDPNVYSLNLDSCVVSSYIDENICFRSFKIDYDSDREWEKMREKG